MNSERVGPSRRDIAVVLVIFSSLTALLVPAVLNAREAARASACLCKICQFETAISTYESVNGHFPAAFQLGPSGRPAHSWRIEILPYLANQALFDEYNFGEPWDGPNNKRLSDGIDIEIFQCPSAYNEGKPLTNFTVLAGEATVFPGAKHTRLADITDGAANTLMFVENNDGAIHWMEPRDVEVLHRAVPFNRLTKPSISSPHPSGPVIGFADGSKFRLSLDIDQSLLLPLSTIAGGEESTRELLEPKPLN